MKLNIFDTAPKFSRADRKVIEGVYAAVRSLSAFTFLELAFSAFAIVYGITLMTFGTFSIRPMEYSVTIPLIIENTRLYGFFVLASGVVGLVGLLRRHRLMRLGSSLALMLLWAGLALHYLHAEPPIVNGFISRGFDSVMEFCIFIRVYANLNQDWLTAGTQRGK